MKKVRKTSKKFLSATPYEYGSVCWEVVVDPEDEYDLVQADLRLTDCNERIVLGFSTRKKKHMAYRLKKLDTLITELQSMRNFLASEKVEEAVKAKIKKKNTKKGVNSLLC